MTTRPPLVEVAAAVIAQDDRYLITQRSSGSHLEGLWEFPGGKRQPGESLETCLRRELREELQIEARVGEKLYEITWHYPERTVALHFFRCEIVEGVITPTEGQAFRWVSPRDLSPHDFPPADAELVRKLSRQADA